MAVARFFELGVKTEALTPVVAGPPWTASGQPGTEPRPGHPRGSVSPPSPSPSCGSHRGSRVFGSHVWGSSGVPRGAASPGAGLMEEVVQLALLESTVPSPSRDRGGPDVSLPPPHASWPLEYAASVAVPAVA